MSLWQHDHLQGLPCRVLLPEGYDAARRWPLVVSLHGSGERGSDNVAQLHNGIVAFEMHPLRRFGAIVVAPQAPHDDTFGGCWYGGESPTQRAVVALTQELAARRSVDPQRVYLVGFSMGAIGGWDILTRHPDLYAAAVLMAGDLDVESVSASIAMAPPIWAVHGERDALVSNANIRRLDALASAHPAHRATLRYTELAGAGHDVSGQTFGHLPLWEWTFAQRRHRAA